VSALAGTISAPLSVRVSGAGIARWLRAILSLLVAVGILAVALPVAFGSGAKGAGVDPVRVFSSGSLVAAETSGGGQLSIGSMVPGESRSATIRVSNANSSAVGLSLAVRAVDQVGPAGVALSDAMTLRVETAAAGPVLYDGPIGQMQRLGLGSTPTGAEHAYRFTVTLPQDVGNEVQGSSMRASFAWNAN
jgi:hypothetical protein